ncbi:MAG: hypothetical protein RI894_493 [Bacteroidota bacterium]|jgi:hypothetical protein
MKSGLDFEKDPLILLIIERNNRKVIGRVLDAKALTMPQIMEFFEVSADFVQDVHKKQDSARRKAAKDDKKDADDT